MYEAAAQIICKPDRNRIGIRINYHYSVKLLIQILKHWWLWKNQRSVMS